MSHLRLVPQPAPEQCRCDRSLGRYWLQGAWNCKGTDSVVRFSPTIGWHHWLGHQTINITHAELEQAA